MKPDLSFLDTFEDKYLKTKRGRGVFLAGVVLGIMARQQVNKSEDIHSSPLFKQMHFGRITMRDLKKQMSRVPELIKAYNMKNSLYLQQLANMAGVLVLESGSEELGVDGNFAFTVGFTNADFFWQKIYEKEDLRPDNEDSNEDSLEKPE